MLGDASLALANCCRQRHGWMGEYITLSCTGGMSLTRQGARTFDSSNLTPCEHGDEPDVFICHPIINTPTKSSMLRSCQPIHYSRPTKLCFLSSWISYVNDRNVACSLVAHFIRTLRSHFQPSRSLKAVNELSWLLVCAQRRQRVRTCNRTCQDFGVERSAPIPHESSVLLRPWPRNLSVSSAAESGCSGTYLALSKTLSSGEQNCRDIAFHLAEVGIRYLGCCWLSLS